MSQRLTFADYTALIDTPFPVIDDDMPPGTVFTLRAVLPLRHSEPDPSSKVFVLEFTAPGPDIWPERIYRFDHAVLGETDIFVVAIANDLEGIRYEAVFN